MKCSKCGKDVKRIKVKDNQYIYKCPFCHTEVKSSYNKEVVNSE